MPRSLLALASIAAAVALVIVAALSLAGALDENGDRPPPRARAQGELDSAPIVERVREGLVQVAGGPRGGSGSGFMIDAEGFILTSRHLVGGAAAVPVYAEGVHGPTSAEVVGTDSATDLALLKLPRSDARDLAPLRLADDASVRLGEPVIAIGAPFWVDVQISSGVVSARSRDFTAPGGLAVDGALETDARMGAGNAGGPLVDAGGAVIGVNARARDGGRAGFAIPIGTAGAAVAEIKEREADLRPPTLGLATAPVSPGLAQILDLPVEHGLLVRAVARGGPAIAAGIRPLRSGRAGADVIVTVAGEPVREPYDVALALLERRAGQRVTVGLVRGQRRLRVRLELARR